MVEEGAAPFTQLLQGFGAIQKCGREKVVRPRGFATRFDMQGSFGLVQRSRARGASMRLAFSGHIRLHNVVRVVCCLLEVWPAVCSGVGVRLVRSTVLWELELRDTLAEEDENGGVVCRELVVGSSPLYQLISFLLPERIPPPS